MRYIFRPNRQGDEVHRRGRVDQDLWRLAWLNRCRRLAKDWENLNLTALMFLRLAPRPKTRQGRTRDRADAEDRTARASWPSPGVQSRSSCHRLVRALRDDLAAGGIVSKRRTGLPGSQRLPYHQKPTLRRGRRKRQRMPGKTSPSSAYKFSSRKPRERGENST